MRTNGLAALMSRFIMTGAAIPEYVAGVPLHTDDNALLEYSAPEALLWRQSKEILAALYAHRQNPLGALRAEDSAAIPPATAREIVKCVAARKDILDGSVAYEDGAAQEAMERLEHALAVCPLDYDAANLLARLYYRIGERFRDEKRLTEAAIAYDKSAATIDNFIRADRTVLGDHLELAVTYARSNYFLGTLALAANRLEQAAAFDKSIFAGVPYADAHNNMGVVHERLGEYEAALNQYRLAIELNPNLVSAYMKMGNTRLKQKKYPEAIQSYQQVDELNPDFALTHYNLGVAYFEQKAWAAAEKEWPRALALKPDLQQARQGLKVVRQKMEVK